MVFASRLKAVAVMTQDECMHSHFRTLLIATALLATNSPALAVSNFNWTSGGGDNTYNNPDNWDVGVPFGDSYIATIDGSGVTVDATATPIDLGSASTGVQELDLTGGATLNDDAIVGDASIGVFVNTDSVHNVSGNLILGNQATGNGSYSLTGNAAQLNVTFNTSCGTPPCESPNGALIVGEAGVGTFTQGTDVATDPGNQVNVIGDLVVGHLDGSIGTYTLNSGTLSVVGGVVVGGQSTNNNQFIQTGGTLNVNTPSSDQTNSNYVGVGQGSGNCADDTGCPFVGDLAVGGGMGGGTYNNTGGTGTYTLSGTGTINAYNVIVGGSGTGAFNQYDSTTTVNTTYMTLGFNNGTYGGYGLYDGALNATSETVGYAGYGMFNQLGGSNTVAQTLDLGATSAGTGYYYLTPYSSTSPTLMTNGITVGDAGFGLFFRIRERCRLERAPILTWFLVRNWAAPGRTTLAAVHSL